jgi:DNA-binding beta-propeller fold protein YncE
MLDQLLSDNDSPCLAAFDEGASFADVFGSLCQADPDFYCVRGEPWVFWRKVMFDLDLTEIAPESLGEQQCVRGVHAAMARAVRTALKSYAKCAGDAGEPPWSCALDLAPDGRFGKALAAIERKVLGCKDASGVPGTIGHGIHALCNRAVVSTDDLSSCMREMTICEACRAGDLMLGQDMDCAALSGERECEAEYPVPYGESFFVANEGDDSVTFFNEDSEYAMGSLGASTFPTGDAPIDIAIADSTNTVWTLNSGSASVTGLAASTGDPIAGTVAASTFATGSSPSSLLVNERLAILYVTNEADDSVTFLDASNGSYVYGTFSASTFPVGDQPSAMVLDRDNETLFVANAGDDTLSLLDAATGAPWFGLPSNSTYATGPEPRSLARHGQNQILVANAGDGTIWSIDEDTGALFPDTAQWDPVRTGTAGSVVVAARNDNIGSEDNGAYAVYPDAGSVSVWDLNDGSLALPTSGVPSDLAVGGFYDPDLYYTDLPPLLVTIADRDVVDVVPDNGRYSLIGVSALERSSVLSNGFTIYEHDAVHGRFFAKHGYGTLVSIDDVTLTQTMVYPATTAGVEYDPATDTVYSMDWDYKVAVLDATTGAGRYGTVEESKLDCGCDYVRDFAVNPALHRLYLKCDFYIAYVDTTTGACLGGSYEQTGTIGSVCDVEIDPASGDVLAGACGGGQNGPGVVRLDPLVPAYKNGTLAASTLPGSYNWSAWYLGVSPDGAFIYASATDEVPGSPETVRIYDGVTGDLVQVFDIPYVNAFAFDPPHDIVRVVSGSEGVVHLRMSDHSFVAGNQEASSLGLLQVHALVDRFSWAGVMPTGPAAGSFVMAGGLALTFFDRDEVEYWIPDPVASARELATGDAPSAICALPQQRRIWAY